MLIALGAWAPSAHAAFPGQNGKIAFTVSTTFPPVIKTINPDGTGQTTVRSGHTPAWAPNGRDLLFSHEDDVRRMPADGSSETVVLDGEWHDFGGGQAWGSPAWSPNGSQIAATSVSGNGMDPLFIELYTASADGSARQRIAFGSSAAWRPDGSLIAFTAHNPNGGSAPLSTVQPDGADERVIVFPYGVEPDYSPDGSKIVYWALAPGDNQNREIFVYAGSGSPPVRLTNSPASDEQPVWSPDGTKIAWQSNSKIYTMNADGTNQTRLTSGSDFESAPSWQPVPYPGHIRPKGASPLRVSLVPAYRQCTAANRQHGPPLAFGSCNPPAEESGELTVGTSMTGFVRYKTIVGNPATPAVDEADIALRMEISDVSEQGTLADYAGEVAAGVSARITDRYAGVPMTSTEVQLPFTTQCTPTAATNVGSTCSLNTTLDALIPGAIAEGQRTVLQLGQVQVIDGGPDADTATEPNNVFLRQGVFVP